ncbi:hypothetical protein BJV74DRAFT_821577 [Russula compacta]|nr:hypothetical protein BJV74DRAFT_821577 [Russula compacta]
MPEDRPFNVYREQLTSLYHGLPLWESKPIKSLYDKVSIGDVGYVLEGFFYRIFNVTLPWDHPSNKKFTLEPYEPLKSDEFANVRDSTLARGDHTSRSVSGEKVDDTPDDATGVTYKCRGQGAVLSLPHEGDHKDVIRTKVFEDYIRDNVLKWFSWTEKNKLGVERMEDLILVSGCTLVTSWAAAVFVDHSVGAEISLATKPIQGGRESFDWSNSHGTVHYNHCRFDPASPSETADQCVFIRGFRAKAEIQVTRVPDAPEYRDPLIGVLDYILEKCLPDCPVGTIAIAHDDDLRIIDGVDTFTADVVQSVLREKNISVLIENGAAILQDNDVEPPVPDERKVIFYASADLEGEAVPLVLHPVLTKYLLTLETDGPIDYDYELPKEEITSPAVHPPMLSLKLENFQGYPQIINIHGSGSSPVTVQEALIAIHEDLRGPSPRRAWSKLSDAERTQINESFKGRCRTEEDLSKGPIWFDYLGGRDRLQIFPRPQDGVISPAQFSAEAALDESRVAGPSTIPLA